MQIFRVFLLRFSRNFDVFSVYSGKKSFEQVWPDELLQALFDSSSRMFLAVCLKVLLFTPQKGSGPTNGLDAPSLAKMSAFSLPS